MMEPPRTGRLVPLTPEVISNVIRNFAMPSPGTLSPPPPISPTSIFLTDRPPVLEEDFSIEQLVR